MQADSCCAPRPGPCVTVFKLSEKDQLFYIDLIKKVARIAVFALALYMMPATALIMVGIGFTAGAILQSYEDKPLPEGELVQVCTLGYIEFCSGTKYDRVFYVALTAAVLGKCILHESKFFVGMLVGFVGFSWGKEIVQLIKF